MTLQSTSLSTDFIPPVSIHWKDIFQDLATSPFKITETHISEILDRERSSVQYWKQHSKDIPYAAAVSILSIHSIYCGKEKTEFRLHEGMNAE